MINNFGFFILLVLSIWVFFITPPRGTVTRNDFGDAWPLTVDSGVVACVEENQIIFFYGGTMYALNSQAIEAGYQNMGPILADDLKLKDMKATDRVRPKKILTFLSRPGKKRCEQDDNG